MLILIRIFFHNILKTTKNFDEKQIDGAHILDQ